MWLAATMKLVCWGMWLAPFTACRQHAAGRTARCAHARPRLPAADTVCGTWISRVAVVLHPLGGAFARRGRRPAREQLLQLGDRPQRRDVDALGQRDAGVLERARQLRVHQAVEAQLAEPAAELHLDAPPARHGRDRVQQPGDLAALARRHRQRALGLLVLAADARDLGDHVAALDRALGGLGQIAVPEVQHLDALPERQLGRHLAEVLLDALADLGGATASLVAFEVDDHRARDLLADAVGEADDGQLLDVRAVAVELLELVGVDVLAVGVDDDVLLAADEVQVARPRRSARGRRCGASRHARPSRGRRGPASSRPSRCGRGRSPRRRRRRVGLVDLDLDAGQRLADRAGDRLLAWAT